MSSAERLTPLADSELPVLFTGLEQAPALLLAVSGGPDSTALLLLAARWRRALAAGPALLAVTVDHGLRAEAREEAAAVRRLAKRCGVAHRTLRWTGPKPKTGLQQAARLARYRLLGDMAARFGASDVLTAHTCDDQAETLLIRMSRGSGLTGLRGMARISALPAADLSGVRLVRPLLPVSKARLIVTLAAAGVDYAEDPSNRDPRFTRSRMRALLPGLAREGLSAPRFAQLAGRLRRADAALEAATDAAWRACIVDSDSHQVTFGPGFAGEPDEIRLRLLGRAIAQVGDEGPAELGKLEALHDFLVGRLDGSRVRRTLAGALVTAAADRLTVARAPARRSRSHRSRSAKSLKHPSPLATQVP